jgi:hypothetical protein
MFDPDHPLLSYSILGMGCLESMLRAAGVQTHPGYLKSSQNGLQNQS